MISMAARTKTSGAKAVVGGSARKSAVATPAKRVPGKRAAASKGVAAGKAVAAGKSTPGVAKKPSLAAVQKECDLLNARLVQSEARVAELEALLEQALNRIDWAIDSLQNGLSNDH